MYPLHMGEAGRVMHATELHLRSKNPLILLDAQLFSFYIWCSSKPGKY